MSVFLLIQARRLLVLGHGLRVCLLLLSLVLLGLDDRLCVCPMFLPLLLLRLHYVLDVCPLFLELLLGLLDLGFRVLCLDRVVCLYLTLLAQLLLVILTLDLLFL
jgi:hypothetical protein